MTVVELKGALGSVNYGMRNSRAIQPEGLSKEQALLGAAAASLVPRSHPGNVGRMADLYREGTMEREGKGTPRHCLLELQHDHQMWLSHFTLDGHRGSLGTNKIIKHQ